jgi:hypothetical protein
MFCQAVNYTNLILFFMQIAQNAFIACNALVTAFEMWYNGIDTTL